MSTRQTFLLTFAAFLGTIFAAAILWLVLVNRSSDELANPLPVPEQPVVQETQFGQILSIATRSANLAITQTPSPTVKPAEKNPFLKGEVTIALLGDSMVDTMGDLKTLELALLQYWPNVTFKLSNYGVGSTPVESGLERLTKGFRNHDQDFPPLLSQKPDIVIVESFAYNHPLATAEGLSHQTNTLGQIIQEVKKSGAQPIFLATIGPNSETFAQGAPGILWDQNQRKITAQEIRLFLDNALSLEKTLNIPTVDAYHPSLDKNGNGKQIFISPNDNIHPSQAGIELVSDLVTQKLKELSLVEKALQRP